MTDIEPLSLADSRTLLDAAAKLSDAAVEAARKLTDGGKRIDDHQVVVEKVVYAASEVSAARELLAYGASATGSAAETFRTITAAGVADLAESSKTRLATVLDELGLSEDVLFSAFPEPTRALLRRGTSEATLRGIGKWVLDNHGRNPLELDELHEQIRASVRDFASREVAPKAEHIHRHDELVPESIISGVSELGYFGLAIPEEYGGSETGNLAMILTTEELSRASLACGGSLITRPEILAKALLSGGTEEQKQHWLPKLASGEAMVAISVTEPNFGSDVASIQCRAARGEVDGQKGWLINGQKAWCTFAGRADVIALLARTDPDSSKGAKGLSLFIVPKDRFDGHEFTFTQPGGGKLEATADRTVGYRGMHSFTMALENFFVPEDNLVGGTDGEGRGFYLQMAGFAAGRLQTGGRAAGLAQAAIDTTVEYANDRAQFKQPISEFQLTRYKLGRMATRLAGARAITYAAALAMDEDERKAAPLAAMAKLFACDVAVEVTQEGQLLHGGWGYAEEYAISRYVVDALVLPIFEGVKPVLELKVVARSLLAAPKD